MKGKVVVKAKKAKIPSKKQDAKRIKKQAKAASKLAKKLVAGQGVPGRRRRSRPATTSRAWRRLAFFPAKKTVKVGQAVTFTMSNKSTEGAQRGVRAGGVRGSSLRRASSARTASIRSRSTRARGTGTGADRGRTAPATATGS